MNFVKSSRNLSRPRELLLELSGFLLAAGAVLVLAFQKGAVALMGLWVVGVAVSGLLVGGVWFLQGKASASQENPRTVPVGVSRPHTLLWMLSWFVFVGCLVALGFFQGPAAYTVYCLLIFSVIGVMVSALWIGIERARITTKLSARGFTKLNRGFSLAEMLGVVVVMGILAGAAISISTGITEEAKKQTAFSNAQALNAAKQSFRNRVPGADSDWLSWSNDQRYARLRDPDQNGDLADTYLPMSPATVALYVPSGYSITLNLLYEKCDVRGPDGKVYGPHSSTGDDY